MNVKTVNRAYFKNQFISEIKTPNPQQLQYLLKITQKSLFKKNRKQNNA